MNRALLALALLAALPAHAEGGVTVGVNLATYHFGHPQNTVPAGPETCRWDYDSAGQDHLVCEIPMKRDRYRNQNFGIYFAWPSGPVVGAYLNSQNRHTVLAGYQFSNVVGPFDVFLGAATGYSGRPLTPALTVSVKLGYFRIHFLPPPEKGGGGVHLSMEVNIK